MAADAGAGFTTPPALDPCSSVLLPPLKTEVTNPFLDRSTEIQWALLSCIGGGGYRRKQAGGDAPPGADALWRARRGAAAARPARRLRHGLGLAGRTSPLTHVV